MDRKLTFQMTIHEYRWQRVNSDRSDWVRHPRQGSSVILTTTFGMELEEPCTSELQSLLNQAGFHLDCGLVGQLTIGCHPDYGWHVFDVYDNRTHLVVATFKLVGEFRDKP